MVQCSGSPTRPPGGFRTGADSEQLVWWTPSYQAGCEWKQSKQKPVISWPPESHAGKQSADDDPNYAFDRVNVCFHGLPFEPDPRVLTSTPRYRLDSCLVYPLRTQRRRQYCSGATRRATPTDSRWRLDSSRNRLS